MYKLVSEVGRWALKDNSMIFSNVVWLLNKEEAYKYHLIDENKNDIEVNISDYIVESK